MEGDPDFVLIRKWRELFSHLIRTLGGDADAPERFRHLEVELDFLVRLTKRQLVEVNGDAGIIVQFAQVTALRQLRLALGISERCFRFRGTTRAVAPATAADAG